MGKVIRLNGNVDIESVKRLKHCLVEEEITFTTWLQRAIDEYVEKKEAKAKRKRRGK